MKRYGGDPYWTVARYGNGWACARCGATIKQGARVFYYPNGRKVLCEREDCGQQASADFHAAASDEAMMCGESY